MTGMGNAALTALRAAGIDVAAVITDPVAGQGFPHYPCRDLIADARDAGVPVWTGLNLRSEHALERVLSVAPDALVIATSPKIVGAALVDALAGRAINCHPSLLPRHRGPTPVAWTIACGDAAAGITFIQPIPELDAGPVWRVVRTPVDANETAGELRQRLDQVELPAALPGVVADVIHNRITPRPQMGAPTSERHFVKALASIDFGKTVTADCLRWFRAATPYPGMPIAGAGFLTSLAAADDAAILPGDMSLAADGTCLIGAADGVLRGTWTPALRSAAPAKQETNR